jgi:glycosyltransferase involved in cell wall biosynthesis
MPRISVIIPTYNRSELLVEAIGSVLDQTFGDFELLVVDDGSTDNTHEVVKPFLDRVRYTRTPHRGVSAARNLGVRMTSGQWVAFLDSDDLWLPRKLELQLEALERESRYRICYTDEIWIKEGRRVNPGRRHRKFSGFIFEKCLPLCIISPSSVLIRRDLLEDVGGFDERFPACEDYDLWLRITAREPVLFVEEKLIIKRAGHPGQLSNAYWGMDRFRALALRKILRDPSVSADLKRSAEGELKRKCHILIQGALKRRRWEAARLYEELAGPPYENEEVESRVLEEDLTEGNRLGG